MSQNYAQQAHIELLAALDAFSAASSSNNYAPTVQHALAAVQAFLPMLCGEQGSSLVELITSCQSLSEVQSNEPLRNLLSNLKLYCTDHYQTADHVIQSKEALLILSLCNDILNHLIASLPA